jgi:hypothetical protein
MKKTTIKHARERIREAFIEDPSFKETYVANVGVLLYDFFNHVDTIGITDMSNKECRDEFAERIIDLIFSE